METNKSVHSDDEDIFPGYGYDPSQGLQEDVALIGERKREDVLQQLKQIAEKSEVDTPQNQKSKLNRTSIADVEKRIKQSKAEQEKQMQMKRREQLRNVLKKTRRESEEWQHDMYDKLEKKPKRDLDS